MKKNNCTNIILWFFYLQRMHKNSPIKKKRQPTNAQNILAESMDLNDSTKTLLYAILLGKYDETSKQIKGNDLSNEEKKNDL